MNSHYAGYGYFKDSSIVYMDMSCFSLTVACSNKNNKYNYNNKKMENPSFSQSAEKFENVL